LRVICPTLSELNIIKNFLLTSSIAKPQIRLNTAIVDNYRNYLTNPLPNGYKALHLILEVDVPKGSGQVLKIPCEVQLRTIFMDTWASISHLTLYQADHNTRRRKGELLKELGIALEKCEEIAEKLAEKLQS
jgi:ppGpp synthetase/RelA/SpoT-type nucleotidyltranferase